MGKYADGLENMKGQQEEINVEIVKTRMLQAIANELAESNRLKRLDLLYRFHIEAPMKFQLEDKT